jgi:threonine aldolase
LRPRRRRGDEEELLIDLRSDTVTCRTEEMRRAMLDAPVGDNVFGEDPTVAGSSLVGHPLICR